MSKAQDNIRRKRRMEKKKKRRESTRPHYNLYLNKKHADHAAAADTIERLLEVKKFTPAVVVGVRLFEELDQHNDTSLLFEKYPWIIDRIIAGKVSGAPDDGTLAKSIVDEMELRGLVYKNQAPGLVAGGVSSGMTGKTLTGFKELAMPIYDEDDDDLLSDNMRKDTSGANTVIENMLRSVKALGDAPIPVDAPILNAPREFKKHLPTAD